MIEDTLKISTDKGVESVVLNPFVFPTKTYAIYISVLFLSMLGLNVGYALATTSASLTSIYQGIELLSFAALFFSLSKLIKVNFEYSYFRLIAFIYLIWQLQILARGEYSDMDYMGVKQFFFDLNYGSFVYIIPLFLFIKFNLYVVNRLFIAAIILSIVYLICVMLNTSVLFDPNLKNVVSAGTAESYFKYLALPVGILALNFHLQNKKVKFMILVVLCTILLVGIFRARRGMILMTGMISFFSLLNFFITSKRKYTMFFYAVYISCGLGVLFLFNKGADIQNIKFFQNLSQRGLEDTRGYVENCFVSDMSYNDWLFGKGYNVGYKCPGIDDDIFKGGVRKVIETDYLQLIMTGGILSVLLLLMIMIPAVVLGIFYSENNLVKTCGVWILLWLLFLYPSNVYSFSLYHISVWLAAGICYTRPLRELSDLFVKNYFLSKIKINPEIKNNHNA